MIGLRAAAAAVLSAALAAAAACGPAPPERAPAPSARTYQVRGLLEVLPDPTTGAGQLRIRHEAIPELVGASGEVEGMPAMSMPFPVAGDLDLVGLAVGDRVRFELTVDWQAGRPVTVTAIDRLPPDTELKLD